MMPTLLMIIVLNSAMPGDRVIMRELSSREQCQIVAKNTQKELKENVAIYCVSPIL